MKLGKPKNKNIVVSFIGSAGIPNRYGGFESFLENCAPEIAKRTMLTIVTCDSSLYSHDSDSDFLGVRRIFVKIKANGFSSIFHDLFAFAKVYFISTHIIVLGVSGGIWFPFFKILCLFGRKRLGVNVDGVEWRRKKFGPTKQKILRLFDFLAQRFSDVVIYDNAGLRPFIYNFAKNRAIEIGYSGDHVIRLTYRQIQRTALTICRIEPENNLDMMIEGVLNSKIMHYTIVGNWSNSFYGVSLRNKYASNTRLLFLDPIYDAEQLSELRESCAIYLHGHSVGGTNPSLVEMLFYDSFICCFDVVYNRVTAGDLAFYFSNSSELVECLNSIIDNPFVNKLNDIESVRRKYTRKTIAASYLKAITEIKTS